MRFRIHFTALTLHVLRKRLDRAYELGDKRLVRRISALLAYNQEQEIEMIAQDLSVSEETIYAWLRAFLVDQFASLTYQSTSGRPSKLNQTEKRRLKKIILAGPQAYGLRRGCWSSLLVQQVILNEFGVLYNRNYVCDLLKNLGFSYQKAKFVSAHLDPQAREQWLLKTWPELVKQASGKQTLLLFVDEVSFPQWGTLSYTWALRGQQPTVPTCGKRKAYKVFGAVDAFSGRLFYEGIQERFNSQTYCHFLTHLLHKTNAHLIIVQDGARYHTSADTRAFFEAHPRLTRVQLPSYSPDFNPIEHLWKAVREDATHNKYFPDFGDVINSVEETLQVLIRHPKQVRQILGSYASAENLMPKVA